MRRWIRHSRLAVRDCYEIAAESVGLRPSPQPRKPAGAIPDIDQWHSFDFAACWIGHATVLLRIGDITILTDPHFRDRSGFRVGKRMVGRRRSTLLPGGIEDLPPIDVVLLSHAHFDHWDRPTLVRLAQRQTTAIIPAGTRRLLPHGFGNVVELPWKHDATSHDMRVHAIRPRHWGARWLVDAGRGYNSYVIEANRRRVLFAGDTGHTHAFDTLQEVDLAIFGIGSSYEPYNRFHASPEEVADMASRMHTQYILPMHHSTFHSAREPIDEPLRRLLDVWSADRIVCGQIGEIWSYEETPAQLPPARIESVAAGT